MLGLLTLAESYTGPSHTCPVPHWAFSNSSHVPFTDESLLFTGDSPGEPVEGGGGRVVLWRCRTARL